jgi:hypothetical protein
MSDRGQGFGPVRVELGPLVQPAGKTRVGGGDERVDGPFQEFGVAAGLTEHNAQQVGLAIEFGQGVTGQQGQLDPQITDVTEDLANVAQRRPKSSIAASRMRSRVDTTMA